MPKKSAKDFLLEIAVKTDPKFVHKDHPFHALASKNGYKHVRSFNGFNGKVTHSYSHNSKTPHSLELKVNPDGKSAFSYKPYGSSIYTHGLSGEQLQNILALNKTAKPILDEGVADFDNHEEHPLHNTADQSGYEHVGSHRSLGNDVHSYEHPDNGSSLELKSRTGLNGPKMDHSFVHTSTNGTRTSGNTASSLKSAISPFKTSLRERTGGVEDHPYHSLATAYGFEHQNTKTMLGNASHDYTHPHTGHTLNLSTSHGGSVARFSHDNGRTTTSGETKPQLQSVLLRNR